MSTIRLPKPPAQRMTVAEYLSGPVDHRNRELIYGEVVVSPKPSDDHQDTSHFLGEVLRRWSKHHDLGKVSYDIDMVLDEAKDLVYAPDLIFVAKEHHARRRAGRLYGAADLCVEIVSPNDKARVQRAKFRDYARYGVPWYWIVNTLGDEPVLEENELVNGAYTVRSEVIGGAWFQPAFFPGLELRLPPLLAGDLKAAVKGKVKRLM